MESSLDRENSRGTTKSRVADDDVHKHGEEVSSAEDAATAASSVRGAQERMMSGSKRLEGLWAQPRGTASAGGANPMERHVATPTLGALRAKNLQMRREVRLAQAELQRLGARETTHHDGRTAEVWPDGPNSLPTRLHSGGWATPSAQDRIDGLQPDPLAADIIGTMEDRGQAFAEVPDPVTASKLAGDFAEAMEPGHALRSAHIPLTGRSTSPVADEAAMDAAMLATRGPSLPTAGQQFSLPALDEALFGEDRKMRVTFRPSEVNSKMHAPATALPRLDLRILTAFSDLKPTSRANGGYRNWREQLADLLDAIAIPRLSTLAGACPPCTRMSRNSCRCQAPSSPPAPSAS